jgi:hypothetical protein
LGAKVVKTRPLYSQSDCIDSIRFVILGCVKSIAFLWGMNLSATIFYYPSMVSVFPYLMIEKYLIMKGQYYAAINNRRTFNTVSLQ